MWQGWIQVSVWYYFLLTCPQKSSRVCCRGHVLLPKHNYWGWKNVSKGTCMDKLEYTEILRSGKNQSHVMYCLSAFIGVLSFQSSGKYLKLCFCSSFIFPLSSFDNHSVPFSSACGSVSELLTGVAQVEACCLTGWGRGRNSLPAEGGFSPIFFPSLCFSQP